MSNHPPRDSVESIELILALDDPYVCYVDLPHIVAQARHPHSIDRERFNYAGLRVSIEEEFKNALRLPASDPKRLALLDPLTETQHTFPIGNALKKAVVTPSELIRYLKETRPQWKVLGPSEIRAKLDVMWKRLPGESKPTFESGMVRHTQEYADGQKDEGSYEAITRYEQTQRDGYERWQKRLSLGRYTLNEAALEFSQATGESARAFFKVLERAIDESTLQLYEPGSNLPHGVSSGYMRYFNEVHWSGLNALLASDETFSLINWRFPAPQETTDEVGAVLSLEVENELGPSDDAEEKLAKLFDPVSTEELEKMFPTVVAGKGESNWKKWSERAARNGLSLARESRAKFNPYKASMWWLSKQSPAGWSNARRDRTLANNLPARSKDQRHLLLNDDD